MNEVESSPAAVGNWGRWGPDDERGTLNLLDDATVLAATKACTTGKVYNLGLPVQRSGVPIFDYRGAPQRLTLTSETDGEMFTAYGSPDGCGANEDVLVVAAHNGTHMDALAHVYSGRQLYNGMPASSFASHTGASKCGIEKTGGFAARAVLLDITGHLGLDWCQPGYKIGGDDLEACRAAQDITIFPGDVLLVRTGYLECFAAATVQGEQPPMAQPGLDLSAVSFVRDNDIAAVGADNAAVECIPFDQDIFVGVHIELLVKLGVTFLEHLVLAPMAKDRCHVSLLIVAPLLVTGGTGSPVNPIAIG